LRTVKKQPASHVAADSDKHAGRAPMPRNCLVKVGVSVLVFGLCSSAAWFSLNRHPEGVDWRSIVVLWIAAFGVGAVLGMKWWWQLLVIQLSQVCVCCRVYPPDPLVPLGIILAGLIITAGWFVGVVVRSSLKWVWKHMFPPRDQPARR